MSITYHVYANNGAGGPIDWTTIVATTASLAWTSPTLAVSSDTTYGVRAYDTVTTWEEQSIDATARVVLDGAGVDITTRPTSPTQVTLEIGANGSVSVNWVWFGANPPTGFNIYKGTPTISYGTPALILPYSSGRHTFRATLTGLTDGSSYQVGVRAYNATGEDGNLAYQTIVADATGPLSVDYLTVTLTP